MKTVLADVPDVIASIARGGMVVVCDDEERENEGDLVIAAELITPDDVNFMVTHGRGLVCLPMSAEMVDRLEIPNMVRRNNSRMRTAFTASIDAAVGVTDGVSAADRARTIRVAVDPTSGPADLAMPGHVFPLRARPGGVFERAGHTEAAVDLARLAGLAPASVICEVMNTDGTMARTPDLARFATRYGLKMLTVAQIVEYRRNREEALPRRRHPAPAVSGRFVGNLRGRG